MDERLQFNWKLSSQDREMLTQVAGVLHRSQADTLRMLVREVHAVLKLDPPTRVALPEEVAQALRDGRLKVADLTAPSLDLGPLDQYDLTPYVEERNPK